MAKAIDAAIYLSNKVNELKRINKNINYTIDYYKIHKMLYIAQGIMLAKYNKTLFDESIRTHIDGPNIDGLSIFYGMVGCQEIEQKIEEISILGLTPKRKLVLDYVAEKYGCQTRDTLIFNTKQHKPYLETFNTHTKSIAFSSYPIMPIEDLKSFFKEKELNNFNLFCKAKENKSKIDSKDITITKEEYEKIKEFLISLNPEYKAQLNNFSIDENKQFTIKIKK